MENRIAVSVIVPAYNAEKVVDNCIGSISIQSLKIDCRSYPVGACLRS